MHVIGLTGCAGSGKSYVCDCIRSLNGFPIIDSDAVCRSLMAPGKSVYKAVVREFGRDYVGADGALDRGKLAERVFNDREALKKLNSLTHPATIEKIRKMLADYEKKGVRCVFVESALASEAGYRDFCDELWVVTAPLEQRIERLRARGYSDEKILSVLTSQQSQDEITKGCDRQIYNGKKNNRYLIYHQLMFFLKKSIGKYY